MASKKVLMAYAIGMITCGNEEGEQKRFNLKDISEDWKDYVLTSMSGKICKTYNLIYDGPYGDQRIFSRVMSVYYGLDIEHVIHLFTQAIDCHKKEINDQKDVII